MFAGSPSCSTHTRNHRSPEMRLKGLSPSGGVGQTPEHSGPWNTNGPTAATSPDGQVLPGCRLSSFLSVRSCGIGGRLVSRSGRSAVVLVGLRQRSEPSWLDQVGSVRVLGVSGVRCGCQRWSGRRSREVLPRTSRFGRWRRGWGGPLRQCLVKSRPMVAAADIGPQRLIGRRGSERNAPR